MTRAVNNVHPDASSGFCSVRLLFDLVLGGTCTSMVILVVVNTRIIPLQVFPSDRILQHHLGFAGVKHFTITNLHTLFLGQPVIVLERILRVIDRYF